MARGIRSNVTLLPVFSPAQQPQSLASYDPVTRRNTILVANIVPTLKDGAQRDLVISADRYYAHVGAARSTSDVPTWMGTLTASYANFDGSASSSSELRQYATFAASGVIGNSGLPRFIHPFGPFGRNTYQQPKNTTATLTRVTYRARYTAATDYTQFGVGAQATTIRFNTSTEQSFNAGQNGGAWQLTSCDGTTISSATGGTSDTGWHDFAIVWLFGELRFYVDGVLTITKTTNVPFTPLFICGVSDATRTFDMVDILVDWPL